MKRAILIDADAKSVTEIQIDPHVDDPDAQIKQYDRLLNVDMVTVIYMADNDVMYLDDEGLLKNPQHMFWLEGVDSPLAGRAIVHGVSYNDEGDDFIEDAHITLDKLREMVRFVAVADDPRLARWLAQFN